MIAVFLIGAAVILLLYDISYSRSWIRALSVRVLFSQPHLYANETGELVEIIENRKRLALPILEIGFRVPRGLTFENTDNTLVSDYVYKRDVFAVSGMERIVRRYQISARKRGRYTVSQLSCHAPSRLFRRILMMDRMTQENETVLYVYPARVNCSLLLRAVEVILGERESARRVYEDPFTFASIRPYTIYDAMKTINWKASAKAGELMVNTYASPAAISVHICLDVSADPHILFSDSFRELAIATAASLIRTLVTHQQDASLLVNCLTGSAARDHLSPEGPSQTAPPSAGSFHKRQAGPFPGNTSLTDGSAKQTAPCVRFLSCMGAEKLTAVEEFLTSDFDSAALIPFETMIASQAGTQRASAGSSEVFIFLTSSDSMQLRRHIHSLLGNRHSGILAVMSRTTDHFREQQEGNLHILPVYEMP